MNDFYAGNDNGDFNGGTDGNFRGNGHGINSVTLIDCRVAGPADYIPAHVKQGATKETQAQANVTVYQNIGNKKMTFALTAWGKMADVVARGCSTGKQLHLICSVHSYRGRVWFPTPNGIQPQFVTMADGMPLMIEKIGFTIEDLSFGVDSAKTIQEELNSGFRPHGWNDPTQPGYQEWRARCSRNNSVQFQNGMTGFGYARVKQVAGAVQQNQQPQQQMPYNNSGTEYNPNQQFQPQQQNTQWQNQRQGQAQQYHGNTEATSRGFQQPDNGFQQNQNGVYVNNQYVGERMPENNGYNNTQQFQPQQPSTQWKGGQQQTQQNSNNVVM